MLAAASIAASVSGRLAAVTRASSGRHSGSVIAFSFVFRATTLPCGRERRQSKGPLARRRRPRPRGPWAARPPPARLAAMSQIGHAARRVSAQAIQAALWMVVASLTFAAMSAAIREATLELHPFEVAFFRNLFGLVFLLPWLWQAGLGGLRAGRRWLYGWRAFVSLLSMLLSFTALAMLPFAQAIALSFTTPLFSTIGAALLLGETVRARRWSATIVGFLGVLIMVRPGATGWSLGAGLAILAAAISAETPVILPELHRTHMPQAICACQILRPRPRSL